ncbi:MAG: hypothetical protein LC130_05405 [Bryobacterales bacterium]|nr:hypothetical protein [Bryobacterales bacterium]
MHQLRQNRTCWPIWEPAGTPPPAWPGWPEGKRFALVLTHDVELNYGVSRCGQLANLEEERGFRSAFAFVPRRYKTPETLRHTLTKRGFEVMVHGLYHDGKEYHSRKVFEQRRAAINDFLTRWDTRGFASPSTHHNLPWISELNIDYDISTYDTDPFEPHPCGTGRIFPYWVQSPTGEGHGFVEMPYTLPQDFTLFILMREQTNEIWRKKLDWIAQKGGMALVKTHPDYMAFHEADKRRDRFPVDFYTEFLDYARARYGKEVWSALPSEVARYWRSLCFTDAGVSNVIPPRETLCTTCRQALIAGWLNHYQPNSSQVRPPQETQVHR